MSVLSELNSLLEKMPVWRRIKETPARVDALESRLAKLEQRLSAAPGDKCPRCGEPAMRRKSSEQHTNPQLRMLGTRVEIWKCEKCGEADTREVSA